MRDATSRFEVMHQPALTPADVTDVLAPIFNNYEQMPTDDRDYLGRAVQAPIVSVPRSVPRVAVIHVAPRPTTVARISASNVMNISRTVSSCAELT